MFVDFVKNKMEKLVFDYTYCSDPECWEWNIPFEYESKEKFILDVLENPMILDKLGITSVYQWEIEDGSIFEEDYVKPQSFLIFVKHKRYNYGY